MGRPDRSWFKFPCFTHSQPLTLLPQLVAGSVVMAFEEVCPERIDLIHKNYRKLCNLLIDVEEWGQVVIISMLTRYARTQFLSPTQNVSFRIQSGRGEGSHPGKAPTDPAVFLAGVLARGEPREGLLWLRGGRGQRPWIGGGSYRRAACSQAICYGSRSPVAAAQHEAAAAEPQRCGGHGRGAALLPPGAQGGGGRHRQGAGTPAAQPQVREAPPLRCPSPRPYPPPQFIPPNSLANPASPTHRPSPQLRGSEPSDPSSPQRGAVRSAPECGHHVHQAQGEHAFKSRLGSCVLCGSSSDRGWERGGQGNWGGDEEGCR